MTATAADSTVDVLATGSFVADPDLRDEFTTNARAPAVSEHGTGAGHRLARDVGATLRNMDLQWLSFRVGDPLYTEPAVADLVDEGAILVGPDGERYVNEEADYDQLFASTTALADGECYVVFDQTVADGFTEWPNYLSTFPGVAYGYVADYLETDYLTAAPDVAALAEQIDLDPDALAGTVSAFNDAATGGRVDTYGRTNADRPLDAPSSYALGPITPVSLITDGGVAVNTRLEALDAEGAPIRGLYAVGDTAGAPLRLGHGHHHLWLFNSGRIAGEEAADRAD